MVAKGKKVSNNYNSHTTDDQKELLIEVTQDDKIVGKVTREECHNETRKPWHRTTHTYLFTSDGKLYLSRRSKTKDTAVGQWTVSAGGHVNWDEGYLEAAKIEVYEELGLRVKLKRMAKIAVDFGSEREMIVMFVGVIDKKPHIKKEEIGELKAFDYEDIIKRFKSGMFDLSGGSRDSLKYLIEHGILDTWRKKLIHA
jgi:isopentenyldiphosphate isomerase